MRRFVAVLIVALALASPALAHLTPPVVLVSDRDAVLSLLAGARRFFVREVRLGDQEKAAIKQASGWTPDEDFSRFYVGRDDQGRLIGALVFVADATIHGGVRVAVALGHDGKVRGASVVELTEETYPWVKPLIDEQFTRDWIGHDSQSRFVLADRLARVRANSMTQFYGEILANLVRRGALLYAHGMARAGGTAMLR
jgi:Na+-translocating ferredoxin:NAD+ oxidoreductase RnfG subunit